MYYTYIFTMVSNIVEETTNIVAVIYILYYTQSAFSAVISHIIQGHWSRSTPRRGNDEKTKKC